MNAPVAVGFHSLRHTAVSMLRDAGASMAAAMAITGHTSAALLLDDADMARIETKLATILRWHTAPASAVGV